MWETYQSSLAFISATASFKSSSSSVAILKILPRRSFSREYFSSIFSSSGSRCSTLLSAFVAFISRSLMRKSFSAISDSWASFSISLSMISFSKTSISALASSKSFSCPSYAANNFCSLSVSVASASSSSLIRISGVIVPSSAIQSPRVYPLQ